jgi:HK97 family phage major capsid protein
MIMVGTILRTDGADAMSATAGTSTGSYLVPRNLYAELIKAVRKNLVLSSLAARRVGPSGIQGSTLAVTLQTPESMSVRRVAEGAEVPVGAEEYSGFTITPVKYGVRIFISEELREDSNWDVAAMNVETAGYHLACNEEALIVAQLDAASTASGHDVSNSNATLPITDITEAIQNLRTDNYTPTHFIIGATLENDLYNIDTFTHADASGINDPSRRLIGKIAGMKVIVSNSVPTLLGYVIDRNHAFMVAEKRPITVKGFFNIARDSTDIVVTQRIGVRYIRSNAVSEITTT